jgi:hypothetical protein
MEEPRAIQQHQRLLRTPPRRIRIKPTSGAANRLIRKQIWNFRVPFPETPLIHKLPGVTLWTTPDFQAGSSASSIGYFLLNFSNAATAQVERSSPQGGPLPICAHALAPTRRPFEGA